MTVKRQVLSWGALFVEMSVFWCFEKFKVVVWFSCRENTRLCRFLISFC